MKGAALAACEENVVDFLLLILAGCCWFDGVKEGESTLNVFGVLIFRSVLVDVPVYCAALGGAQEANFSG